jgi:hypothetical protein
LAPRWPLPRHVSVKRGISNPDTPCGVPAAWPAKGVTAEGAGYLENLPEVSGPGVCD